MLFRDKNVCSRCLTPIKEFHENISHMCRACGNHYETVERIRKYAEPYNPPHCKPFSVFQLNGKNKVRCPNCGGRATVYGKIMTIISCPFCNIQFTQNQNAIVKAYYDNFSKEILYLSNDHLPYFEQKTVSQFSQNGIYSTKMEQVLPIYDESHESKKVLDLDEIDKILNL